MKPDLLLRSLFALFAIPLTLFIVFYGGGVLKLFLLLFICGGAVEFYLMLKNRDIKLFIPSLLLGVAAFAVSRGGLVAEGNSLVFPLLFAAVAGVICYEVYLADPDNIFQRAGATLLAVLYLGVFGSYMMIIPDLPLPEAAREGMRYKGTPLVMLLVAIWSSDSLAYFLGKYFGKKLLLPKASPKKTVMGLVGSMLGGGIGMIFARSFLKFYILDPFWAVVIGLLLGFFGQVGDLFESLLKRSCNVKDSSNIFPGHGGILDRIDALLFCAPIYYYLMRLCT